MVKLRQPFLERLHLSAISQNFLSFSGQILVHFFLRSQDFFFHGLAEWSISWNFVQFCDTCLSYTNEMLRCCSFQRLDKAWT